MTDFADNAALRFLAKRRPDYLAKLHEARTEVEKWLGYIPQTFPHYTRHTVQHSDEIIGQISKFLFRDEAEDRPVVPVTGTELYIVCASALFHDAGMVASDVEKGNILRSTDWSDWVEQSAKSRVERLEVMRKTAKSAADHFAIDIHWRHLLAEFIRRHHHLRSKAVIDAHADLLGRINFGDPGLSAAIADVCMAHGLSHSDLDDSERYPDRRDIRGEQVSLRFASLVLRLGDLLDMSNDRACPLLLNAACPLPSDSFAHWTQYSAIKHRLTTVDRIEITARCRDQAEHRVLANWCQWIVDEVRGAQTLMARSVRHRDWPLPFVSIGGADATLRVAPAADASYVPSTWVFEMDRAAVFDRLIRDVYDHPLAFLRELLQNALDATRCRLYELNRDDAPESPTRFSEAQREALPIRVTLAEVDRVNGISGEKELRQLIVIEDPGIGMDRHVIENYLLQVGRSFYATPEFARRYAFVPTSRFGIGFLSAFAVSKHVVVETRKDSESSESLRITLTGVHDYLLVEKGGRSTPGTRIEVLLDKPLRRGEMLEQLRRWCVFVEFPIIVDDLGQKDTLRAERSKDLEFVREEVGGLKNKMMLRAFPVNRSGIEGSLLVFVRLIDGRERWGDESWLEYEYPKTHPAARPPTLPESVVAFHGIMVAGSHDVRRARIDFRDRSKRIDVSRSRLQWDDGESSEDSRLESRWNELVEEHLLSQGWASEKDWVYVQHLIATLGLFKFLQSIPYGIQCWRHGERVLCSVSELSAERLVWLLVPPDAVADEDGDFASKYEVDRGALRALEPVLTAYETSRMATESFDEIFDGRELIEVAKIGHSILMCWRLGEAEFDVDWPDPYGDGITSVVRLGPRFGSGFYVSGIREPYMESVLVLNADDRLIRWIVGLGQAAKSAPDRYRKPFEVVMEYVRGAIRFGSKDDINGLKIYLERWRRNEADEVAGLRIGDLKFYPKECGFGRSSAAIVGRLKERGRNRRSKRR